MFYSLSATVYPVTRFVFENVRLLNCANYLLKAICAFHHTQDKVQTSYCVDSLIMFLSKSLWLYRPSFFLYQRSQCIDLSVGLVNLRASVFTILSSVFCIVIFPPCLNILPRILSVKTSLTILKYGVTSTHICLYVIKSYLFSKQIPYFYLKFYLLFTWILFIRD